MHTVVCVCADLCVHVSDVCADLYAQLGVNIHICVGYVHVFVHGDIYRHLYVVCGSVCTVSADPKSTHMWAQWGPPPIELKPRASVYFAGGPRRQQSHRNEIRRGPKARLRPSCINFKRNVANWVQMAIELGPIGFKSQQFGAH